MFYNKLVFGGIFLIVIKANEQDGQWEPCVTRRWADVFKSANYVAHVNITFTEFNPLTLTKTMWFEELEGFKGTKPGKLTSRFDLLEKYHQYLVSVKSGESTFLYLCFAFPPKDNTVSVQGSLEWDEVSPELKHDLEFLRRIG